MKNRTNHSAGGFQRITRLVPQVKIRVFGFAMVVMCGSILVAWLMHSLWGQLGQLQRDYAAVQSESFYFGVHLRNAVRGLNSQLLQFGISHDPAIPGAFLNNAADLKNWISTNQSRLGDIANLQLLRSADFSE